MSSRIMGDTDAIRRQIDEQDRLDAEEIMVAAMAASVGSSRSVGSSMISISSKRRSKPPALPPPPTALVEAPPKKFWVGRNVKMMVVALAASVTLSVGATVLWKTTQVAGSMMTGFAASDASRISSNVALGATDNINTDRENEHARLKAVSTQNHRIQHTKYSGMTIPAIYQQNTLEWSSENHEHDMPVMFRIPMSGDESLTEAMGLCLNLVQAADERELMGQHLLALDLHNVNTTKGTFLNVDLSTYEGVEQAKSVNLASLSNIAALSSPMLNQMVGLFDDISRKGRFFAMFQNPAQRLVAFYYSCKNISSRYYDPGLEEVTLDSYANWPGDRSEFNFVVKSLISSGNELITSEELTANDLKLAKAILKEHFMVLLAEDKFGSWAKLATWLGWTTTQGERNCVDRIMVGDWPRVPHDAVSTDSDTFLRLEQRNAWDIQLYEFAQSLYQQQTETLVS